jgi:hypothetical protein
MKKLLLPLLALALSTLVAPAPAAHAITIGSHRFSLTGGLVVLRNPDQTSFAIGAEYEYRAEPLFGFGGQASHLFGDISVTILSAPTLFVHPLGGDFYVTAAPVFYFVSGYDTRVGARFTTRMPLELSFLTMTPTFGVDVIQGGPNYILGLSLSI